MAKLLPEIELPDDMEEELRKALKGETEPINVNGDIYFIPPTVHGLIESIVRENRELREKLLRKTPPSA